VPELSYAFSNKARSTYHHANVHLLRLRFLLDCVLQHDVQEWIEPAEQASYLSVPVQLDIDLLVKEPAVSRGPVSDPVKRHDQQSKHITRAL
jgi:hypothetical protein